MKILFLSWNYPPVIGGIEDVAAHLVDGFHERAESVHLLTAGLSPSDQGKQCDPAYVERAPKTGLKACLWNCLHRGNRLLKERDFDLIVCPSIPTALPASILAARHKKPWVLLMHGTDIKKEGLLYQRLVRTLVKRPTFISAASENTARLCREAGVSADRITAIHPGVDVAKWATAPTSHEHLYPGRRVLISVGRLIKRKGILEFVRNSMPTLAHEEPGILYLIVGDDATQSLAHNEPMRERIQAAVIEKGLQEHVKLLGKIPFADLQTHLHRAELFLLPGLDLPNDAEGFGIVFSEAALCGTPAIATRVGGMPEAVEHGVSGLLAEAGDYDGLNAHILQLLRNPDALLQLREDGAARVRREFAWPVVLDRYEALFNRATI